MAYDIPPPDQRPESGYYYHFKHDPAGPLNNYAYATTPKMTVALKTALCRCIGRSMRILTPTGTAVCSTSDRCTCSTSPPSGRGERCPASRRSPTRRSSQNCRRSRPACMPTDKRPAQAEQEGTINRTINLVAPYPQAGGYASLVETRCRGLAAREVG